jgi:hypothetical protein
VALAPLRLGQLINYSTFGGFIVAIAKCHTFIPKIARLVKSGDG